MSLCGQFVSVQTVHKKKNLIERLIKNNWIEKKQVRRKSKSYLITVSKMLTRLSGKVPETGPRPKRVTGQLPPEIFENMFSCQVQKKL